MATISENLVSLNEEKLAQKSVFESNGVDMTNVPFTQYHEKMSELLSSGGGNDEILKSLIDGSITSIKIPDETSNIHEYVFYRKTNLSDVTIPNTVTSIGLYAFAVCTNLESVSFEENSQLTSIGSYVFQNCTKLRNITIPNTVTNIGSFAFSGCANLLKIVVPESVTRIQASTFNNCVNIIRYDFTKVTAVPTLSNVNAFTGINANCKISVPDDLYDEWIVATNWSTYASYIVKASEVSEPDWHTVWTGSEQFITNSTTNIDIPKTVDGVVAGRTTRVSGNATVNNFEGNAFTNIELTSSPTNINLVYIDKYNKMYPPTTDNSLTASVVSRGTIYRNSGIVLKEVQQYY